MRGSASLLLSFVFVANGTIAQQGALDPSFNSGGSGANSAITRMVLMPNGRIVVFGYFTLFNGTARNFSARLLADGSLDPAFVPDPMLLWPDSWPSAMDVQADGKVIIGRQDVSSAEGGPTAVFYRLNTDGSVDPDFQIAWQPGATYNQAVYVVRVDPNTGKIYVGGDIQWWVDTWTGNALRVMSTGAYDGTYNPWPQPHPQTRCMTLLPDGRLLIGGYNTTGVQRLNLDGTTDATFTSGALSSGSRAYAIERLPDNKILLAGSFTTYAGAGRSRIARLNADGTLDASFDPGTGANGDILALASQPDGKILIGGSFATYNGTPRGSVARLNADGSLDTSFDPGTGANGTVNAIALRPDGQVLIAGNFTAYNGAIANRIALLSPPVVIPPVSLQLKALLEGPYASGVLMTDGLRTQPTFPLTEPFTAMGYSHATYTAGQSIAASVLTTTGNNAIVDWVIVELRLAASPGTVVASRAALLQRDGDVVGLDGSSSLVFQGLGAGNYCPAIRPRNHLPVMLSPGTPAVGTTMNVDFTNASTQLWDSDARTSVLGALVLVAGDISFNGTVQYTGSGNDRDPILVRVGSTTPNSTVVGYWREDLNMDGTVKYTGSFNDRDRILVNVGPTTPNNTRVATLP